MTTQTEQVDLVAFVDLLELSLEEIDTLTRSTREELDVVNQRHLEAASEYRGFIELYGMDVQGLSPRAERLQQAIAQAVDRRDRLKGYLKDLRQVRAYVQARPRLSEVRESRREAHDRLRAGLLAVLEALAEVSRVKAETGRDFEAARAVGQAHDIDPLDGAHLYLNGFHPKLGVGMRDRYQLIHARHFLEGFPRSLPIIERLIELARDEVKL